jgi:predicted transcriptional regulator
VHQAFATPGQIRVQLAQLPDGGTFLCFARTVQGVPARWGEPAPVHVVAMGCDVGRAPELVYSTGLDLETAMVGIGLSCRLCDRADCRSRAFPPLEHRLSLDPLVEGAAPWRFEAKPAPPPSAPRPPR